MKKLLIFGSPIIFLVELLIFNSILELISAPSDIMVVVGVCSICLYLFANYHFLKFIYKTFKTKKDEKN